MASLTDTALAEERRSMNTDAIELLDAWELDTPAGRLAVIVVDHTQQGDLDGRTMITTRVVVRGQETRTASILGSRWEGEPDAA